MAHKGYRKIIINLLRFNLNGIIERICLSKCLHEISSDVKKPHIAVRLVFFGSSTWARTRDTRINRAINSCFNYFYLILGCTNNQLKSISYVLKNIFLLYSVLNIWSTISLLLHLKIVLTNIN